ncbi:MAG TPA: hypothetical protein VNZ49_13875 [Bacteroidia bacterium]|jgi:hypothetical protein|nr:hypothetical protein [Bacteroidia bacterium]
MKTKLITSALFLFVINTFAQTFADSLKTILKKNDVAGAKIFMEKSKHKNVRALLNRQILNEYFEMSFESRETPGYLICIISNGDKIIYSKLVSARKKIFENEDSAAVKQFYKAYSAFFGTKVKTGNFFADTVRYGKGCGFVGADPPERKKMKILIAEKNHKELSKWLQSAVTEKQLYAIEGFKELEKGGYVLSSLQKKLIDFIKTKKGNYQDCNGCIYSSTAISDLFKKGTD